MQGLHTHTAMRHADLPLPLVWDHLQNLGGSTGRLEVDAYLHGIMTLPCDDRNMVAQAVNELLDDLAATGRRACCRAPYCADDDDDTTGRGARAYPSCKVSVRGRWGRLVTTPGRPAAPAGRRPQGLSSLPPLRRDR
ncbi:hypothetical protein IWX63_001854 [Arthrobacter sp. CAN_A2]|uniref:hypothetical protein n=1 Tax=Arthrobacter sp. CAN_A2 TaxID=2787718 RepID=UPI0018EF503A